MVTKVKPQQIVIRSIQDYNEKIKDVSILKNSISIYTRVSTKGTARATGTRATT